MTELSYGFMVSVDETSAGGPMFPAASCKLRANTYAVTGPCGKLDVTEVAYV